MSSDFLAGSPTVPTGQMLWEKRGTLGAERPGKRRGDLCEGMGMGSQVDCGLYSNSLQILLGFIPKGPCLSLSHQPQAGIADPQHLSSLRLSKTGRELT